MNALLPMRTPLWITPIFTSTTLTINMPMKGGRDLNRTVTRTIMRRCVTAMTLRLICITQPGHVDPFGFCQRAVLFIHAPHEFVLALRATREI
ncbi:MAG: hypothetical protein AAFS01_09555 [Pseudomonadota bacterium]